LFNPDQKTRPEALIIGDDHLVEPALAGVRAAGLRLREDVEVVAHANFPWSPAPLAPITRIGWETGHLLSRCIDCLDAQRRGETVEAISLVPALFENELRQTPSAV
jgi:DNA-binding LacI/PurR family transcriptional regulator